MTTKPEKYLLINNIDKYIESYRKNHFSSFINKRNNENEENNLFYRKIIVFLLKQRDSELLLKVNLKDRHKLLNDYNWNLYSLTDRIMQLFKAVNDYLNSKDASYLTKILIKEDDVLLSLKSVKDFSKIIKHNLIDDNDYLASKIRDYCILMFDDWIDLLNDSFGIDIYKSPLGKVFEETRRELENSISETKQVDKNSKPKEAVKTFFYFIHNVKNKEAFAKDLKNTFNIEEGRNLRIMVEILCTESIISIPENNMYSFHKALKLYFERDIASYESFRKAKDFDSISIEKIRVKLNPLISKHKM